MKFSLKMEHHSKSHGFTLIEIAMGAVVLSIIALFLGDLVLKSTKLVTDTDHRFKTDINLRTAMDKVEIKLLNANYFELARSTEVIFRADMNTDPNYNPNADTDGDGIKDIDDPDVDNDATLIVPSTAQWRIGYNLKDDDDDGDNKVDMRWRIRMSTALKNLYIDYSKNEEAWGNHEETVLTQMVSTTPFTFYGSKDTLLCPTCGSTDTNNDGIISASEIDAVANGGNGNGVIDTSTETNKIVSIGVYLDQDSDNSNTKADSHLSLEVMPPMLYLKRRP